MTALHQPKSRERVDFKEDDREKEPQKQLNEERPATGPGKQLRQKNKGKCVCNADVIG